MSANFAKKFLQLQLSKPLKVAEFNSSERISFPNISQFIAKVLKLREQHHDVQIITDFDHTLTKHKYQEKVCDSLFGMWVRHEELSQDFKKELIDNYMQYGPYETDSSISFSEKLNYVNKLYEIQTSLFEKHRITNVDAGKVLGSSEVIFRSHTEQLLQCLNQNGIPMYIVSGGISDIIYNSLISISNPNIINNVVSIHSNEWQTFKPQESFAIEQATSTSIQYLKFKKNIIHSYNKHKVMAEISNKKKNCIVMGDLKSDIYMAYGAGYQNVLSIFYGKEGDTDQRMLAERKFDIIVEADNSHKIVIELVKIIKNQKTIDWRYLYSIDPLLPRLII